MQRVIFGLALGLVKGAVLSAIFIGIPTYFWFDDLVAFAAPWFASAK